MGTITREMDAKTFVQGRYIWTIMRDGKNEVVAKGHEEDFDDAWREISVRLEDLASKEREKLLAQSHRALSKRSA